MIKQLKTLIKAASVVFLLLFTVEKTNAQLPMTKEAGVIPPEFNKNNDTLLIFSGNLFYNKAIKKQFNKYYTGVILFVKKPEKYSIETCRYVLYEGIYIKHRVKVGGPFAGQQSDMVLHDNFRIEDRKTNEKYINTNPYYSEMMKDYLTALDEARKN